MVFGFGQIFCVYSLFLCGFGQNKFSDWLLNAMPLLKIWLPAHNDLPIIGFLFNYGWIPFVFSWVGCLYDLSIPFLLWNRKYPTVCFAVVVFHSLTALLFPIGMFPYIMIVTALIFFSGEFHQKSLIEPGGGCRLSIAFIFPQSTLQVSSFVNTLLIGGFLSVFSGSIPFAVSVFTVSRRVVLDGAGLPFFVAGNAHGKGGLYAVYDQRQYG